MLSKQKDLYWISATLLTLAHCPGTFFLCRVPIIRSYYVFFTKSQACSCRTYSEPHKTLVLIDLGRLNYPIYNLKYTEIKYITLLV